MPGLLVLDSGRYFDVSLWLSPRPQIYDLDGKVNQYPTQLSQFLLQAISEDRIPILIVY
jgi:hypothetical protein